jgi:hypothetical protein
LTTPKLGLFLGFVPNPDLDADVLVLAQLLAVAFGLQEQPAKLIGRRAHILTQR